MSQNINKNTYLLNEYCDCNGLWTTSTVKVSIVLPAMSRRPCVTLSELSGCWSLHLVFGGGGLVVWRIKAVSHYSKYMLQMLKPIITMLFSLQFTKLYVKGRQLLLHEG